MSDQKFIRTAPVRIRWAGPLLALIFLITTKPDSLAQNDILKPSTPSRMTTVVKVKQLGSVNVRPHGRLELSPLRNEEVSYSLTLITSDQASFDVMLENYFPSVLNISNFQAISPYLVMIRNDTPLPAVAYSIQWKLIYQNGDARLLNDDYISRPLSNGQEVTLLPGDVRLVSPVFNLTPQQYESNQGILTNELSPLAGLVSSVVEIEGVVYRGGTYSGPEGVQVWRRHIAALFAAHDEALYVLNLLNSTDSLQSVYPAFGLEVQRELSEHRTDTMGMYVRARGEYAERMETLLLRNGRDNALRLLENIASNWPSPGAFTILGRRYMHLKFSAAQTGNAE